MNKKMRSPERAAAYLKKAETYLRWSRASINDMEAFGVQKRIDDVERSFSCFVFQITALQEALLSCATALGDEAERNKQINTRKDDPLLNYLYKARDTESHDAIVKWRDGVKHLGVKVADPERARNVAIALGMPHGTESELLMAALVHAHDCKSWAELSASSKKLEPNHARMSEAGIFAGPAVESLFLTGFTYVYKNRTWTVAPPKTHLGTEVPDSAYWAARAAVAYYSKAIEWFRTHHGEVLGLAPQAASK